MAGVLPKLWYIQRWVLAIVLLLPLPFMAQGQQFTPYNTRASFRDAVVDTQFGRLFVAAYDRNEIWAYDPMTLERLDTIAVGQGPSALALSAEGSVLAAINRADETVSLVRLVAPDGKAAFEVYAKVSIGAGPASISATPDNRFVVANSFSDTVSIIDPSGNGSASTVASPSGVPVDAALIQDTLAVITRTRNALFLLDAGSGSVKKTITLDAQPVSLSSVEGDRLAVASS